MTTAETIPKTTQTLRERGMPEHSWFEAVFADGSRVTEREANWSSISEAGEAGYFGGKKRVHLCTLPVKRIEAHHDGLRAALDVPEGHRAYQAVRGETLIMVGNKRTDRVIGRTIGLVRDGEVVEEKFLNGLLLTVEGLRK